MKMYGFSGLVALDFETVWLSECMSSCCRHGRRTDQRLEIDRTLGSSIFFFLFISATFNFSSLSKKSCNYAAFKM